MWITLKLTVIYYSLNFNILIITEIVTFSREIIVIDRKIIIHDKTS